MKEAGLTLVSTRETILSRCCLILRVQDPQKWEAYPEEACGTWGCSSAGRAPALQAGGQEFDPPHLHQLFLKEESWFVGEEGNATRTKWAHSSGG